MMLQQPLARLFFHKEIKMHQRFIKLASSRPTTLAITVCISFLAWTALSNEREQTSSHRTPLAVLDVAKVFKEAQTFNEKMKRMKVEIDDFDRNVRARRGDNSDQLSPGLKAEVE